MADIFHHYHVGLSQPCRSVLMILKLTNAPHEVHHVDFRKGDNKKPDFPNPFGRVPTIVHGDFVLTESPAIAKYILNVQKGEDTGTPDLKKRARVDEFLSYYHTSIRKAGIQIAVTCVFTPMRTGKPAPEEDKQQALKDFDEALARFEGYFLKNGLLSQGKKSASQTFRCFRDSAG
ncbi:putative glutathione S-transferase theta-1-like [Apostichopus japonicus]|uniref:Putative glutathione S-transferase theta-1-like n=1 Tax=Stichopus japonicus TaxID=307972 RepID=A0A2G8L0I1_STIJA|nr:putative glutathione S-transferase theta-1-like [Apostichopus japonicus]